MATLTTIAKMAPMRPAFIPENDFANIKDISVGLQKVLLLFGAERASAAGLENQRREPKEYII